MSWKQLISWAITLVSFALLSHFSLGMSWEKVVQAVAGFLAVLTWRSLEQASSFALTMLYNWLHSDSKPEIKDAPLSSAK